MVGAALDLHQRSVECPAACRARSKGICERLALVYELLACEQFCARDRGRIRKRGGITHENSGIASAKCEPSRNYGAAQATSKENRPGKKNLRSPRPPRRTGFSG